MNILPSCLTALALLATGGAAVACSPPAQADESGFFRHEVTRLPKNALGVMFYTGRNIPSAAAFKVVSTDDKRVLRLHIRQYGDMPWVRLELEGGFQPGARYAFHYVRSHGAWRYPDKLAVTIDDTAVETAGHYALALAPHAVARVVTVPTGSGSCWEPAAAIAQEFTYAVPTQLAGYRAALMYDIDASTVTAPAPPELWPRGPELYYHDGYLLGQPYDPEYSAHRNAVVAACGSPVTRGTLQAVVAFPEVDDRRYRTAPVAFDLGGQPGAACRPTDALARTMRERGAERVLRQVCYLQLGTGAFFGSQALAARPLEEWERGLDFLHALSPTCNLMGLAYLWETRQFTLDRRMVARLGAALRNGLETAQRMDVAAPNPDHPPAFHQAVQALDYLVRRLPPEHRDMVAVPLLAPLQPMLVAALAAPVPYQPDQLAALIMRSGALPAALRASIRSTAGSATPGAPHARAILAAAR
jgi:hypothetical protein